MCVIIWTNFNNVLTGLMLNVVPGSGRDSWIWTGLVLSRKQNKTAAQDQCFYEPLIKKAMTVNDNNWCTKYHIKESNYKISAVNKENGFYQINVAPARG